MFRMADLGIVLWPVELPQALEEGGTEHVTVHIGYRILTRKELRARERTLLERFDAQAARMATTVEELVAVAERITAREAEDVELLLERITDWRGIGDEDGDVPFSRDRLAALLEWDVYFKPIAQGLMQASRHGPPKNSLPGPGGTPARDQA